MAMSPSFTAKAGGFAVCTACRQTHKKIRFNGKGIIGEQRCSRPVRFYVYLYDSGVKSRSFFNLVGRCERNYGWETNRFWSVRSAKAQTGNDWRVFWEGRGVGFVNASRLNIWLWQVR